MIAMDVEMCERRSDGARYAVSAALLLGVAGVDGELRERQTLFEALLDPGEDLR